GGRLLPGRVLVRILCDGRGTAGWPPARTQLRQQHLCVGRADRGVHAGTVAGLSGWRALVAARSEPEAPGAAAGGGGPDGAAGAGAVRRNAREPRHRRARSALWIASWRHAAVLRADVLLRHAFTLL